MRQVYSGAGRALTLGAELGRGGEGAVFVVRDNDHLVAKLYQKPLSVEHQQKLMTMVSMRSEQVLRIAAWPTETLHERPFGPVVGFTMPRVSGYKPIHLLYGPKSRLAEFPSADWSFLVHTAANLARVFGVVHDHSVVIGDVNHDNAVVSQQGTIMLWDLDSAQILHSGKVFRCEVGVPTHTPPELQGQSLRGTTRTKNHDRFGLAVLIFQLLFLGRHPFSGVYLGPGDMPVERAIREQRFVYGAQASSFHMQPPPGVPALSMVGPSLGRLFEKAFSPPSANSRPAPHEWVTELTSVLGGLSRCSVNPSHIHIKSLASCPWCQVERLSGIMTFGVLVRSTKGAASGTSFKLDAVWAAILRVPDPGPLPPPPEVTSFDIRQSPQSAQMAQKKNTGRILAWVLGAVTFLGLSIGTESWLVGIVVSGLLAWAISAISGQGTTDFERSLRNDLHTAQRQLSDLRQRWNRDCADQAFRLRMEALERSRHQYLNLAATKNQKLRELESNARQRQLEKFLDKHRIQHASIPGIGPGRKATLQSWGIETALDVNRRSVGSVPGFGPSLTSRLMDWRASIEKRFVFNAKQGLDPSDVEAVERDVASLRVQLEQDLLRGAQDLQRISQQIGSQRRTLQLLLTEATKAVAQAQANLHGF